MTALLTLLLTAVIGTVFLRVSRLVRRADVLVGTGFLVGTVLLTLAMLLLAVVGIAWSPGSIIVTAFLLSAMSLAIRARTADGNDLEVGEWSIADPIVALLVLVHALYVTESAPRTMDYWAIWGLKAKIFFANGGTIDLDFLTDPTHQFAHVDYPPLVTLMFSALASWGQSWNDRWFGLLDTAFVLSTLLIIRGFASRLGGSTRIGAWTAAIVALPLMQSRFGIADVPMIAFITASLLALETGRRDRNGSTLLVGAMLLGGAALTKNEGIAILVVTIVVFTLLVRRMKEIVLVAVPAVALAAVWQIPRLALGLSTDVTGGNLFGRVFSRLASPDWMRQLVETMPGEATAAVIGLLVAVFVARDRLRKLPLLLIVSASQLAIYVLVYAGTPNPDVIWHIDSSWERISLHIAVPILTAVAIALVEHAAGQETSIIQG